MFYIFTLDGHDCYGPFLSRDACHAFAARRSHSTYAIETDTWAQQYALRNPIHLVPDDERQ